MIRQEGHHLTTNTPVGGTSEIEPTGGKVKVLTPGKALQAGDGHKIEILMDRTETTLGLNGETHRRK